MPGEAVGKQAAAVFKFAARCGLFAEFRPIGLTLGINTRFGPVSGGISIQPVTLLRPDMVFHLRVTLDG
ncbi:hypothetical protein D3C75_775600 [compost metagenome]